MSESQNGTPWQWHIEETFKGLIALSIELLKALLLINGGAAVSILAYLGNLASHASPAVYQRNMKNALLCFSVGVLTAAVTFLVAYLTQLRLYHEERARHERQQFPTFHSIGITIGTILVIASAGAFGAGCWIAASAFQTVP
jgi:uncharacterized membrane protein YidH (DUF202 family)